MSNPPKWVRDRILAQRCGECGQPMTEYAVRELRFRLLPNQDEPGYGGLMPIAVTACPTCGNEQQWEARDVTPALMKRAVGWLVGRTERRISPFSGKPIVPPEKLNGVKDNDDACRCEWDKADDADEDGAPDDDAGNLATAEPNGPDKDESPPRTPEAPGDNPVPPKPKHPNRGRRLTSPSIRSCCPRDPIGPGTLKSARRVLRCYSDRRDAPSFPRLMLRFGVQLDADGNDITPPF